MKKKNANKVDEKTNRDHRDGRRRQMSPSMTTEATPGGGFSLPPTPPRPSLFLKTAPTNQCRRRPASAIKMAFSSLPSLRDGSRVIDRQKKNTKKKRRRRPRPDIIGKWPIRLSASTGSTTTTPPSEANPQHRWQKKRREKLGWKKKIKKNKKTTQRNRPIHLKHVQTSCYLVEPIANPAKPSLTHFNPL